MKNGHTKGILWAITIAAAVGTLLMIGLSTARGEAFRYTGSTPGEVTMWLSPTEPRHAYFSRNGVSATLPGEWTFDLTTDGQHLTWDAFTWSFETTAPLNHHIGQIDFALDAEINLGPASTGYDINPVPQPFMRTSTVDFHANVSGHYRSLSFESEFDELRSATLHNVALFFDFSDYERELRVLSTSFGHGSATEYPIAFHEGAYGATLDDLEIEPKLWLTGMTFTRPDVILPRVNAHSTPQVTGNDFLAWQRDPTPFGLLDWERAFQGQPGGGVGGGVPEVSTWWYAVAAIMWGVVFWLYRDINVRTQQGRDEEDDEPKGN